MKTPESLTERTHQRIIPREMLGQITRRAQETATLMFRGEHGNLDLGDAVALTGVSLAFLGEAALVGPIILHIDPKTIEAWQIVGDVLALAGLAITGIGLTLNHN